MLHLTPLVLRLAHILMAYATGPHTAGKTKEVTQKDFSLSGPSLRNAIAFAMDLRVGGNWEKVRQHWRQYQHYLMHMAHPNLWALHTSLMLPSSTRRRPVSCAISLQFLAILDVLPPRQQCLA